MSIPPPGIHPRDIAAERDARLTRHDQLITRCPCCGAWAWRGACTTTPHTTKETA